MMESAWIAVSVAVVLGIIFSFVHQIVRMALAHEEKKLGLMAGGEASSRLEQIVAANEGEMAKLRQRVEVLERLVTDDERRLSREISGLRDDRTPA
jgi:cell division protein FtsB